MHISEIRSKPSMCVTGTFCTFVTHVGDLTRTGNTILMSCTNYFALCDMGKCPKLAPTNTTTTTQKAYFSTASLCLALRLSAGIDHSVSWTEPLPRVKANKVKKW